MKTVLIDDDVNNVLLLEEILLPSFAIKSFTNPSKALHYIKTHHPHVIISDLMMPVVDGLELLKTAKSLNSPNIFIMYTACDDNCYMEEAFRLGVDAYLVKPLGVNEFLNSLNRILQQTNSN